MTDLQASLIAIGGTIVAAVITYNKWQEYKARKSVERVFGSEHDDVLMKPAASLVEDEQPRQEPSFAPEQMPIAPEPVMPPDLSNPATVEAVPSQRVPVRDLPIDELIDCCVPLALEGPVRGDKVLAKLQSLRHVGNKPVHFIGQLEDGNWEPITYRSIYYGLRASVQLANRSTPLTELEYSEFITRLRQIADEMNAELDVPDMAEVMAAARSLHQFATEYDAQLSVNVQSNSAPWAVNTLLSALERQGFDLRPDGRLVMPDGEGGSLFSLSVNAPLAAETTSRLTLLLDVPRVAPARDGFGAMTACAKMLAARLDGKVVDDDNQPLADAALEEIAAQVYAFYGQMDTANVPAGSTRALRLFS
ncbi:cell division protein ZipA C-terminal FtsZ-binding domain-containing protein [Noviherbaspirillum massiliense]|uniref:cell division protein ZipA C-terminal FtsZ-binding domain-containing protein n=1 Tax=Noviherbaspirillum massiliense TaxID=1465823 RepID=UPI0002DA6850|nr:cell division protein ZipA C-terminal FtsZ-binding domain-containing protein [Noviherbaspirillum massiliense]